MLRLPWAQLAAAPAKRGRELCQRGGRSCHPPGDGAGCACGAASASTPGPQWPDFYFPPPPPPLFFFSWKVSDLAEQLEEQLFQLYSLHNEQIQERLHELAEVMERVRQAEDELQQVCRTVEAAYKDLCLQPEA